MFLRQVPAAVLLLSMSYYGSLLAFPSKQSLENQLPVEHLKQYKTALLDQLGLDSVPPSTDRSPVPSIMYSLYHDMLNKPVCSSKIYRVIQVKVAELKSSTQLLEFIVSSPKDPPPLIFAEIRIPILFRNSSKLGLTFEDHSYYNATSDRKLLKLEDGSLDVDGQEMIWDVTTIVNKTLQGLHPRSLQFWLSGPQADAKQAYMLLTSDSGTGCSSEEMDSSGNRVDLDQGYGRIKRDNENEDDRRRGRNSRHCKRKHLYVDFQTIRWDNWIISPSGYRAFYCEGRCPFPMGDHLNSTNHAIIQTLISGTVKTKIPPACCVPTKLKPITMLYFDHENQVVLREYSNMVVESCGCL